jgi:hypothetical protein
MPHISAGFAPEKIAANIRFGFSTFPEKPRIKSGANRDMMADTIVTTCTTCA